MDGLTPINTGDPIQTQVATLAPFQQSVGLGSPSKPCLWTNKAAQPAKPAVSIRKVWAPKRIACHPTRSALALSDGVNPPSGPTAKITERSCGITGQPDDGNPSGSARNLIESE